MSWRCILRLLSTSARCLPAQSAHAPAKRNPRHVSRRQPYDRQPARHRPRALIWSCRKAATADADIQLPHKAATGGRDATPGRQPAVSLPCRACRAEMMEMWNPRFTAEIAGLAAGQHVIRRRKINCFGAGESQIKAMLPNLIRRGRVPTVSITASKTTISLRITAEAATEEQCDALIEPTAATIRQCLGRLVFGEGDEELQHAVLKLLQEC